MNGLAIFAHTIGAIGILTGILVGGAAAWILATDALQAGRARNRRR